MLSLSLGEGAQRLTFRLDVSLAVDYDGVVRSSQALKSFNANWKGCALNDAPRRFDPRIETAPNT